jgi:hypothetical protein
MRACFKKCCNKDRGGRACQDINSCKPCKDAVATGWANYVVSSAIAFKACVDNCETWTELQDRQKAAIQEYTETCRERSENHPQHISETDWWLTVPANGKYPQVLCWLLLELDGRLLGDTGFTPAPKFAHLPENTDDNGGHSMSYMWQENAGAASAFTLLVLAWRQAFGKSLRVPFHSSIPEDLYDTCGGRRLVEWVGRAQTPFLMAGPGPSCADIMATVHDQGMVFQQGGAPLLAINAPPPPPWPPANQPRAPLALSYPTSVVSMTPGAVGPATLYALPRAPSQSELPMRLPISPATEIFSTP